MTPPPPALLPFTGMTLLYDTLMLNSWSLQRRQQSPATSETVTSLHTDRKLNSWSSGPFRRTWSWMRSVEMTVHIRRSPSNTAPYHSATLFPVLEPSGFWDPLSPRTYGGCPIKPHSSRRSNRGCISCFISGSLTSFSCSSISSPQCSSLFFLWPRAEATAS